MHTSGSMEMPACRMVDQFIATEMRHDHPLGIFCCTRDTVVPTVLLPGAVLAAMTAAGRVHAARIAQWQEWITRWLYGPLWVQVFFSLILGIGFWGAMEWGWTVPDDVQVQNLRLPGVGNPASGLLPDVAPVSTAPREALDNFPNDHNAPLPWLPPDGLPDFLHDLLESVHANGLVLDVLKPLREQEKGLLTQVSFQLSLHGQYMNIQMFVQELAQWPTWVVPDAVVLQSLQKEPENHLSENSMYFADRDPIRDSQDILQLEFELHVLRWNALSAAPSPSAFWAFDGAPVLASGLGRFPGMDMVTRADTDTGTGIDPGIGADTAVGATHQVAMNDRSVCPIRSESLENSRQITSDRGTVRSSPFQDTFTASFHAHQTPVLPLSLPPEKVVFADQPLHALRWVGYFARGDREVAVLQDPAGHWSTLSAGQYLGRDLVPVASVTQTHILFTTGERMLR
jgi:hypothetical protein